MTEFLNRCSFYLTQTWLFIMQMSTVDFLLMFLLNSSIFWHELHSSGSQELLINHTRWGQRVGYSGFLPSLPTCQDRWHIASFYWGTLLVGGEERREKEKEQEKRHREGRCVAMQGGRKKHPSEDDGKKSGVCYKDLKKLGSWKVHSANATTQGVCICNTWEKAGIWQRPEP